MFLETHHLSIGYKRKVIANNLHFKLEKGSLTAIVGANGVGKSTLLRSLAGIQKVLSGEILIQNQSIAQFNAIQLATQISVVLTDTIESNSLKVFELVSMGRYPYTNWLGRFTDQDNYQIENALEQTEAKTFKDRFLHQLSDGERQKIMIARALAQDTPCMLLDEPTAHLDLSNKATVLKLLKNLTLQLNKTILYTTHDLDFALQICDSIGLMYQDGGIVKLILDTPKNWIASNQLNYIFQNNSLTFDTKKGIFQIV